MKTKSNWDWIDYGFAIFFWLVGIAIVALAILGSFAAMNQGIIL